MLGAFKQFLRDLMAPLLYGAAIIAVLITIFRSAETGLYLMFAMIPQPNVWHKLHEYPFGKDFMDVLFFSALLGIIVQKKGFARTGNSVLIIIFIVTTYIALINSSARFSLPFPITTSNWLIRDFKNYTEMILLYFLAVNLIRNEDQRKTIIVVMSAIILLMALRSYRNFTAGSTFSYSKRLGGPFEAAGLGANHYGAFIVDYTAVLLGVFYFDKDLKRRLLYIVTILFSLYPLFYSYSRGAYLAAIVTISFFGLVKKRSLLALSLVIFLAWQTILPASVVDRIQMTETPEGQIENSAGGRIALWDIALTIFKEHPVFGIGYGGYQMSAGGVVIETGEALPENQDVHNFYMRTLCEQGVIGGALLLLVLYCSFRSGWKLYRSGLTPFQKGLGFGFMGCVLAVAISNMFGDRWSYFVLGSYFWILLGMVDRCLLENRKDTATLSGAADGAAPWRGLKKV